MAIRCEPSKISLWTGYVSDHSHLLWSGGICGIVQLKSNPRVGEDLCPIVDSDNGVHRYFQERTRRHEASRTHFSKGVPDGRADTRSYSNESVHLKTQRQGKIETIFKSQATHFDNSTYSIVQYPARLDPLCLWNRRREWQDPLGPISRYLRKVARIQGARLHTPRFAIETPTRRPQTRSRPRKTWTIYSRVKYRNSWTLSDSRSRRDWFRRHRHSFEWTDQTPPRHLSCRSAQGNGYKSLTLFLPF